jgi:hypothetical protein
MMGYRIVDTIEGAALEAIYLFCNQHPREVAGQPIGLLWQNQPELYRLKYESLFQRALTYFKRYNPLACRVASR